MDIKKRPTVSRNKELQAALQAPPRDAKEAVLVEGLKSILKLSQARSRMYGIDQYGVQAQEVLKRWSSTSA